MSVTVDHIAIGIARVMMDRVRMQDNGDKIRIQLMTQFGQRDSVWLSVNQLDPVSIQRAVRYLDRTAHELRGDPTSFAMPLPPRQYGPNTVWYAGTAEAFTTARHDAVATLVEPVIDAGLTASAFVGVYAHAMAYADKRGILAAGEETDAEVVVTAWRAEGKGAGWAGSCARDWSRLDLPAVPARAIDLATRGSAPVASEPARRTVILDRPAVAQLIHAMGPAFNARLTLSGQTPLYNPATHNLRLGEQIMDLRLMLLSDPDDPEGGYLPFNRIGDPLRAMTWIDRGVHTNLAFDAEFAAIMGYVPSNDEPSALRVQASPDSALQTVDAMIAGCEDGIYVNRLADVRPVGDPTVGMLTGVTNGGCFLVRNGRIERSIRNLRFLDSPWLFLNRVDAIGTPARTPFGYAPWAGEWPIAPTIVPPLVVRDFNFSALADSI